MAYSYLKHSVQRQVIFDYNIHIQLLANITIFLSLLLLLIMQQSTQAQSIQIDLSSLHILCTLANQQLIINGQDIKTRALFHCLLTNNRLPRSFINIFENIEQLFAFLKNTRGEDLQLVKNTLKIKVKIINFNKCIIVEIPVEIEAIQNRYTKSEVRILQQKIQHLYQVVAKLKSQIEVSVKSQAKLYNRIKDNQQRIKALERKDVYSQSCKIQSISQSGQGFRSQVILDNSIKSVNEDKHDIKSNVITSLDKFKTLIKKQVPQKIQKNYKDTSFVPKEVRNFKEVQFAEGKNRAFHFEIDTSNLNLEAFIIKRNLITRKNIQNDMPFQIYSLNSIAERGRHTITYHILTKSSNSMSIGLITQQQKFLNCVREQTPAIMMNCEKGYELYVDSRPKNIMLSEIKANTYIQFMVELSSRKVKITKNNIKQQAIRFQLPQNFTKKKVYPFIQMMCADDSIEINVIS